MDQAFIGGSIEDKWRCDDSNTAGFGQSTGGEIVCEEKIRPQKFEDCDGLGFSKIQSSNFRRGDGSVWLDKYPHWGSCGPLTNYQRGLRMLHLSLDRGRYANAFVQRRQ